MESQELKGKYVAVLDDFEKWRNVVINNLRHYGCDNKNIFPFETKKDIISAYSLQAVTKPDIAILDINLNPKDENNREGLEVCQFFKQFQKTSIVAISSLENIAKEAIRNGANFFIRKKGNFFLQDFDAFVEQYTGKNDGPNKIHLLNEDR